jgi:type 1 glutamine amidotransferase
MIISDGRDGHLYEEAPHLASPERVRYMDRQMKRGCGFLSFHFSTFAPNRYADEILRWSGGYFQWETAGERKWYSAITTREAEVQLGSPDHPISRGLKPFTLREEFYYNIRFPGDEKAIKPIWNVPVLGGRKPDGNVVAWARQREDGGRGFGTTCGHFYDNWKHEQFRKLILNAIAWTAKIDVPKEGVTSRFYTHAEIDEALGVPIRVLLVAGNDAHKWHNWEKTTPRIKDALQRDGRIRVEVTTDFEELGKRDLSAYQVILLNWCNWHDPRGASDKSKQAFARFVRDGGGLILVHFANGAFHPSLPKAEASDWPEYRKIVRRVWDHRKRGDKPPSGHDAFGKFTVLVTTTKHTLTERLKRFEIVDELYYHQAGDETIEPLLAAESKVTKKIEPLAWAYTYGKGRVFQTLLGHSEKTYDAPEACEVLRRAAAWTAGRPARQAK